MIVVLLLNFQALPDLLLPLTAAGMGFGLLVDNFAPSRRNATILVILLIFIINSLHFGGVKIITGLFTATDERGSVEKYLSAPVNILADALNNDFDGEAETNNIDSPYYPPDMQKIQWQKIQPTSCHYNFADHEIQWIQKTGQSPTAATCGELPR